MSKRIGLGKCLVRDKLSKDRRRKKGTPDLHEQNAPSVAIEDRGLKSVTENNQLQDFIDTAQMQSAAVREDVRFVSLERQELSTVEDVAFAIPRRPKWDSSMSKEEFHEKELSNFMEWRRQISQLPNSGLYEKNVEVWRQLWQVVDKSDIVVQTVDARHPLLFHCNDLDTYIKEVDAEKVFVLLVNKVDFLIEDQRRTWADYFSEIGMNAVFFSAKNEMDRVRENDNVSSTTDDFEEEEPDETGDSKQLKSKEFNREELLEYLKTLRPSINSLTVGFVGYPNVGKSSVINALLRSKQVCTSATPGKTKHFQTFVLEPNLTICDCPGLVMQSSACTKAELVLGGVLPVDEMQDHEGPLDLINTPAKCLFEDVYGFILPSGKENSQFLMNSIPLLHSYGYSRGYLTQRALPDNARSARYIIKDYLKGKLLFCQCPPGMNQEEYQAYPDGNNTTRTKMTSYCLKDQDHSVDAVDSFFEQLSVAAHVKSNKMVRNEDTGAEEEKKPWKKHYNRNKKAKLKKVYSNLDH